MITSRPSNQKPETITYKSRSGLRKGFEMKTIEMFVGMGCISYFGSDSYPYTVWGWELTPAGILTVYVTPDNHMATETVAYGETPNMLYTSKFPSLRAPSVGRNVSEKNNYLSLGHRAFYQNPSF